MNAMSSDLNEGRMHAGFFRSREKFPDRPALEVNGEPITYRQLAEEAGRITAALNELDHEPRSALVALYGDRTSAIAAAMLGTLRSGRGMVPLNPLTPATQSAHMLLRSGASLLVVDRHGRARLDELLAHIDTPVSILLLEDDDAVALSARGSPHRFAFLSSSTDRGSATACQPCGDGDVAYMLFTSGSTGTPKAVGIAHANISRFLRVMHERFEFAPTDRFSQTFPLIFDLAMFDFFVAWEHGACVCLPNKSQLLAMANYLRESALTVWFSTPATAILIKQLKGLYPGAFPHLRLSMFCGEALPLEITRDWCMAAPNSIIENHYGPTELTLCCTCYRWNAQASPLHCENGTVPIGDPYPGMRPVIVDELLHEVSPGTSGELLMAGPQIAPGYWADPERTAEAFVIPPGRSEVYYRTGDRVRQLGAGGPLLYLGRKDNQIQLMGTRMELGEIEAALREAAGVDTAVAFGWPIDALASTGTVAFVKRPAISVSELRKRLKQKLTARAIPRRIEYLEEFPLNANGKIDRRALRARIEQEG